MTEARIQHIKDVAFTQDIVKSRLPITITHTEARELVEVYERYKELKEHSQSLCNVAKNLIKDQQAFQLIALDIAVELTQIQLNKDL